MKVLVIDDQEAVRCHLKYVIQQMGFEMLEASNGVEGLEVLKRELPVDVALVDLYMPVMGGVDFLKAVCANPDYCTLRVIMMSGYMTLDAAKETLLIGAESYLQKPITAQIIHDKFRLMGMC